MKRVKAACICQTLHFMMKEDAGHDYAVKQVKEEVAQYKKTLERNHTQYRITEEEEKSNGNIKSVFGDGTYWQTDEAMRQIP